MNRFITGITTFDVEAVKNFLKQPKWVEWSEPNGKNALHYLGGARVGGDHESDASLKILKLLLKAGMDINSVQRVEDKTCDVFLATPLWYAYTHGRNEKLYKYLLKNGGANPDIEDEKGMSARKLAEANGPKRLLGQLAARDRV